MAEKRMFAKTIIDSDAFLDMPVSSQALYFHLSMRADDEGFLNSPKKIQRLIGASDDDLNILIAKNFIIPFESGVIVIKHWKIHNCIRKDRLHPTVYQEERNSLSVKNNGAYTTSELLEYSADRQLTDSWQTSDRQMSDKCPHRLDKISIDKNRKKEILKKESENCTSDEIPDFDLESAWKKTRDMYPRNDGKGISKQLYLNVFKELSPLVWKDVANTISIAIKLYIKDCKERYGEEEKYIKGMDKWFKEDFDYYFDKADEVRKQRSEGSE